MVEHIIRLGYSPFIRTYKKKNAIMAAVDGAQTETVKFILSFNYIPAHREEFEKSKEKTDLYGNNVLHLAHKDGHKDIARVLEEKKVGNQNYRNHRGLIPI